MAYVNIKEADVGYAPEWSGEVIPIKDSQDIGAPDNKQLRKAMKDISEAQRAVNKDPKNKEYRNALAVAHRNIEALQERANTAADEMSNKSAEEVAALWVDTANEGEITRRAYSQYMLANDLAEKAIQEDKMFIVLPPEFVTANKGNVDFAYTQDKRGNTIARNYIYCTPELQHAQVSDVASALKMLRASGKMVSGHIHQYGTSQRLLDAKADNKAISTGTDSGDIAGEIYHPMAWETWRHHGPWGDGRYAYQFPTPFTDTVNLFDYIGFPTVGYHTENAEVAGSDFTTDKADIAAYEMYETTTVSDKIIRNRWQGANLLGMARSRLENAIYFKMNADFTTGDGSDKPLAITAQITAGNANNTITVANGSGSDIGFNPADLSTAMWELQSAYRRQEGTTITFGSATLPRVLNASASNYYLRQMVEQADRLIRVDTNAGGAITGRRDDDMMVVGGRLDGWALVENEHLGNAYSTASTIIGYAGMTKETCVVRSGPFFVHSQTPSTGNISANNYTVGAGLYTDMVVALHGAVTSGNTGKGPIVNIVTGT